MKKRITFAFISLLLMLYIAVPCFASSTLLVDKAGVLSGTEAVEVLLALEDASTKHGASFVIVTVYGTDNKSMMEYADDFFDYNDYGESGILLLIDMKDGDYWISTSGEFDSYSINYEALNVIEKDILGYLKNEDFYGAFTVFAEDCSDIYNLRDTSEEPFNWFTSVLVALGVGVVAASIVTGVMKKQLNNVRNETRAANYMVAGSMNVKESKDLFLYSNVIKTPKPKSNSSGGSHRSSSGRSHGGRGGSFR